MTRILRREALSDSTFSWELQADEIARAARPGQFVIVRLTEGGERIPLTIADFDPVRGTITVVVLVAGRTTREMSERYRAGDELLDLVGPLGLASEIGRFGRVALVGGGLGVAPLYPQARALREAGNRVTAILGFRSADRLFWVDRFEAICDETIVCTEDGTRGRKGLVTAALADLVESLPPDRVITIGPLPMMRACAEATRARAIPTVVSLNSIMVDGTGMCGSCRVTVGGEVRFACVDGPEFDAHAVDYAGMQRRQGRFRSEERRASEDYDHVCRLETALFKEGRRNYKKIRELPAARTPMEERAPAVRARDFEEVALGYKIDEALYEAERCLQCIRPTCIQGCPVGIDIPRFIRHLLVRDLGGARAVIEEANLFPSICGRVCPQEHQCEAQCVLTKKIDSVAIGRLERFVGDAAPARSARTNGQAAAASKGAPLGGRVGIVGSGPAGLACAADLAKLGVKVTVFEALHEPGGVLRYGIPSFRLPRTVLDREIERLRALGVEFRMNFVVGQVATLPDLLEKQGFDALFVGTGAGAPAFLGIPGEDAPQVMSANEFLTRVHLMHADRFPQSGTPLHVGRRIAVVGAGNTAMDCLRTALRLGAHVPGTEVHCVYRRTEAEAPARIEERIHAQEEGVRFHWLVSPTEIVVDGDGSVGGLRLQKMELGPPDASGRRRAVPVEGEFETLPCDCVIIALGTRANVIVPRSTPGLATDAHGHIQVDPESQGTSLRGVFAGGDIVTGAATVILAMGAGRRAAAGIAKYLETREWKGAAAATTRAQAPSPAVARLCLRCRRPLAEGEGETICCADATLTWRCEGCAKVSEGFAFPYGQCPACGGRLVRTAASPAVAEDEQEAVRTAFEIELGGVAFYSEGAQQAIDSEVRELFERLAAMEREHVATLARRYHLAAPDETRLAMNAARAAVYAGTVVAADDPARLLEVAVALERKARDFFKSRAAAAAPGSRVAQLLSELCAEEEEHVDLLATELERFRRGRAGLLAR
jgi:glutamate synthase (NADPH) small chain